MPGDQFFFWNAIPNLLLIAGLVVYLSRRKSVGAVMAALFVYLSLHNGYAIFAAATGDGIKTMDRLHYESSDPGAKLVGTAFLLYCTALVFIRLENPRSLLAAHSKLLIRGFALLIIFSILMIYGAVNLPGTTPSNFLNIFKESSFAVAMWLVALVFAVVMRQGVGYFISRRSEWSGALAMLALVMALSGMYEIGSGITWAGTNYSIGYSYRASGTLFNPNVLGLWCALMVALVALLFHIGWISRSLTLCSMFVIMGSLALSSSRSGLLLSIITLGVIHIALTLAKKATGLGFVERSFPAGCFFISMFLYIFCIKIITPSPYALVNSLGANLMRFTQLPIDIFWIFMIKLILPLVKIVVPFLPEWTLVMVERVKSSSSAHASGRLMESVDGRILLQYLSDNSYMAIFAIGGLVPLVIWLLLWLAILWLALKKYGETPGILSSYALAGILLCFSSGFFLRTPQLFPPWIFLSMVLGTCIYWCASNRDDPYSRHLKRLIRK